MSNILSFEFEELPLFVVDGIEAGLINGMAEIRYSRNGDWAVESVCLEGHQKLTLEERTARKNPWIYVGTPDAVAGLIHDRLNGEWVDKVNAAVAEQLASDREDAAEQRADMRRDQRMGL